MMTTVMEATPQTASSSHEGPALELERVTRTFGESIAVSDVSFKLEHGTFLTMLGPSGSGKSTTLNMIAGFLEPTSGAIRLRGRDITGLEPYRRGIGMVFQDYSLFPHLSVVRNVAFPLEVRGVSRREAEKQACEALEIVDLADRAKAKPRELSGGQQQRVALARSIVFGPDLLLMDEPLGALDRRLREEMQVSIKRLADRLNATVVFVTHDQEEALVMSDLIAIYNGGAIEQLGTAQQLYQEPASLFVADFIGESNIIRGTVRGSDLDVDGTLFPLSTRPGARTFRSGSLAAVVVRPEQATLRSVHSTPHSAPIVGREVGGQVTEVLYMGTAYRFFVHADLGFDIEVRVRAHLPEASTQRGERVHVSWAPDDVSVVPAP
jgi:ABC-type spermidine/putrescine transport systems, ATPase components